MPRFAVRHPRRLCLFCLLNLADLVGTLLLLGQRKGGLLAYEANPVAGWWLRNCGCPGLVFFKIGIVLLAATLVGAISRRQPLRGGQVLNFSCLIVAGVLVYSGILAARVEASRRGRPLPAHQLRARQLERTWAGRRRFHRIRSRVKLELLRGGDLRRAARELHAAGVRHYPELLGYLRVVRAGVPVREQLAGSLLEDLRIDLENGHLPTAAAEVVHYLEWKLRDPGFREWCAEAPAAAPAAGAAR
jgi:hypothetical protein